MICVCFLQLLCGFYCCCWPLHRTCRLGWLCFFRFAKCYWPKLRKSTRKSTTKKNKIKEEKTRKSSAHMLVKSHCKYNFWESYIIMYSIAEWKLSHWNSRNISLVIYYAGHIVHYVGLYIYPMSIYINWCDPNWGHFPGKCILWKKSIYRSITLMWFNDIDVALGTW